MRVPFSAFIESVGQEYGDEVKALCVSQLVGVEEVEDPAMALHQVLAIHRPQDFSFEMASFQSSFNSSD